MENHTRLNRWAVTLLVSGIVLLCVGFAILFAYAFAQTPKTLPDPEQPLVEGMTRNALLTSGARALQTLRYVPCGHEVLRQIDAPPEWLGLDRARLQVHLDAQEDGFQITSFSPQKVEMHRQIMLYCAQHWVLQCDASGMVCVWVNHYGDAMLRYCQTTWHVNAMPEAMREAMREGVAFDTLEDAELYLEGLEH